MSLARWLALLVLSIIPLAVGMAEELAHPVQDNTPLRFPRDHGAHPDFRIEWWYVTGWLRTADHRDLGFQVTFFRTRNEVDPDNPSRFAARQILFAHAALSDPALGHLLHDQRVARAGFGLAEAAQSDTDVVLDTWTLKRRDDGVFETHIDGTDFALALALTPTQPVLLQGHQGYSRKGPQPGEASTYFTLPQLTVSGTVGEHGVSTPVTGVAWLDREWSTSLLDPAAVGWDWLGVNLDDGGALTAFQMRDAAGKPLWAGGSWRTPEGVLTPLGPEDVRFDSQRVWRSTRTGTSYPVATDVTITLSGSDQTRRFRVVPLFDDQELDTRPAGGPVYWEGAVRVDHDSGIHGRGYLEMTGYFERLKF